MELCITYWNIVMLTQCQMRVHILYMDSSLLITYLNEMETGYFLESYFIWHINTNWITDDALIESCHYWCFLCVRNCVLGSIHSEKELHEAACPGEGYNLEGRSKKHWLDCLVMDALTETPRVFTELKAENKCSLSKLGKLASFILIIETKFFLLQP